MSSGLSGVPHVIPKPCCGRHRRLLAPTPPREPSLPVLYYSAGSSGWRKISYTQCNLENLVRHKGRTKGLLALCRVIPPAFMQYFPASLEKKNAGNVSVSRRVKTLPGIKCYLMSQLVGTGTGRKICLACVSCKIYPNPARASQRLRNLAAQAGQPAHLSPHP